MKKSLLMSVITILLIGGIYGYVFFQKSQNSAAMKQDEATMMKQETEKENTLIQDKTENMIKETTRYTEYSKEAMSKTSNNKRVLFFYANWCPTCIPADINFKENSTKIPSDVTVIRVNYNDPETDADEKALAKQYGITYQHTFVQIDDMGQEVAKWNGGQIEELLTNIK